MVQFHILRRSRNVLLILERNAVFVKQHWYTFIFITNHDTTFAKVCLITLPLDDAMQNKLLLQDVQKLETN